MNNFEVKSDTIPLIFFPLLNGGILRPDPDLTFFAGQKIEGPSTKINGINLVEVQPGVYLRTEAVKVSGMRSANGDPSWNENYNSVDGFNNMIGPCGLKPLIPLTKKQKERLRQWEECHKKAQDLKLLKKEQKIDAKKTDAELNKLIIDQASAPAPVRSGPGIGTIVGISVAGLAFVGVVVLLVVKLRKKGSKPA